MEEEVGFWLEELSEGLQSASSVSTSLAVRWTFAPSVTALGNQLELSESQSHGWVCLFRNMTAFPDLDVFNVKGIHRRLSGLGH